MPKVSWSRPASTQRWHWAIASSGRPTIVEPDPDARSTSIGAEVGNHLGHTGMPFGWGMCRGNRKTFDVR